MTEIQITKIEPKDGQIIKGRTHSGRMGFLMQVTYTLADGRLIDSWSSEERKKDLPRSIERDRESIAAGTLKANFSDDGKFWGTVSTWKMDLGNGRLVPNAA